MVDLSKMKLDSSLCALKEALKFVWSLFRDFSVLQKRNWRNFSLDSHWTGTELFFKILLGRVKDCKIADFFIYLFCKEEFPYCVIAAFH